MNTKRCKCSESGRIRTLNQIQPTPCALGADGCLPGPGSWHHHNRYRDGCERRPGDPALPERPSVPRHLPGVLHVPVWHLPQDGLAQLTRGREHLQLQRNQWANRRLFRPHRCSSVNSVSALFVVMPQQNGISFILHQVKNPGSQHQAWMIQLFKLPGCCTLTSSSGGSVCRRRAPPEYSNSATKASLDRWEQIPGGWNH